MKKILVAFTTNAGSTEKVARTIGEELGKSGAQIEVCRLEQVASVDDYDEVVIGAPMIMGWHGAAMKFIKKHQQALSQKRVGYFLTAMSLTQTNDKNVEGIPVYVDASAKPPKNPPRLSFRERYATPSNYVRPILKAAPLVKPVSVGLFGGKLEYIRLNILQILFVMLIIRADPGDSRRWPAIREWASSLQF